MKTNLFFLLFIFSNILLIAQPMSIDTTLDYDLDVVVTAQYAPTDIKNAVHDVKVISAQSIEKQGFNNLAEVLSQQINLRVSTDLALGNGLKIQGIGGENVTIMIDGVPVIGRLDGNIDLSQINLSNVERVEIIEGSMSAQYGSNAAGGVINVITKKSQLNRFRIESKNQYENIGILNNSLLLGFQEGKFMASVNFSRFSSQFQPKDSLRIFETITLENGTSFLSKKYPWNPKIQYGIDGMLRYRLSDSVSFTYQYRQFDETVSIFGAVQRERYKPYAFDEFYNTKRQDHSFSVEAYLRPTLYYNSTTAYNQYNREKIVERYDFEEDTIGNLFNEQDTTVFTSFLHRSIFSTTSTRKLNGQFGLELLHETSSGERISTNTEIVGDGAKMTNFAAWLGLQYEPIDDLTLQGNLRYGYNTNYEHPLIPSIHLAYKIKPKTTLRASYAHGFRSPNLKELYFEFIDVNHYIVGNTDLVAENSKNISLSINHTQKIFTNHELNLSGKLFYNKIENRITLAAFEPLKYEYRNIDNFETHGFNLQVRYSVKDLRISSAFAYTNLLNDWSDDFSETTEFIALPEMQNELNYLMPFIKTNLTLTHRFIGKQILFYLNDDGELEEGFIGQQHFMNATLSRSFWKKRVFIAAGAKNLTDLKTVPFVGGVGTAHSSTGQSQLLNWGRTYFVRVNLSF